MNLESLRRNKVRVAVGVLVMLAVVGGAYLAFADRTVEISNAEELEQVRENPSGNYVLVYDIDMSEIEEFKPLGNLERQFTGTFDGNGHTISNLTVGGSEMNAVGMFGSVGDEATVENVTLKDVNVTGKEIVGGLAGRNWGNVTHSRVTGGVSGEVYVGGLVGLNSGPTSQPGGDVHESNAEVDVTGGAHVGGLIGRNCIRSTVSRSHATGKVTGRGVHVGGLVGVNRGGIIAKSYATGKVTGDEDVGGLVGINGDSDVTDSYWDVNTTGQDDSAGGVGLTTEEMTGSAARENMEGFDFDETWEIVTNPDDYPRLAWQSETDE